MQKELRSRVSAVPEGEKGCKKKELEIFYHKAREERREKLREWKVKGEKSERAGIHPF